MTQIIKPAPDRTVRHPEQGFRKLAIEGELVNWSPYWERLLNDGDVVVVVNAETSASVPAKDEVAKAAKGGS